MPKVEIEYCVPCGHLNNAQEVQQAILNEYGQRVDAVSLVTGDGGVFKVAMDDELVFDKAEEGYDLSTIMDRVDDRIAATA